MPTSEAMKRYLEKVKDDPVKTQARRDATKRWVARNHEHVLEHARNYAKAKRQRKEPPVIHQVAYKECAACGQLKRLTEFYEAETTDGHRNACKACHKKQVIDIRAKKNPTKVYIRQAEGWRLVCSCIDEGSGMSVFIKGLVIKYDRVSGSSHTRTVSYGLAFDDSGKRYESEARAMAAFTIGGT